MWQAKERWRTDLCILSNKIKWDRMSSCHPMLISPIAKFKVVTQPNLKKKTGKNTKQSHKNKKKQHKLFKWPHRPQNKEGLLVKVSELILHKPHQFFDKVKIICQRLRKIAYTSCLPKVTNLYKNMVLYKRHSTTHTAGIS